MIRRLLVAAGMVLLPIASVEVLSRRDTEPMRVIGLLDGVDVLLISGDDDPIVPVADVRRLAAAALPGTDLWIVPGARHRGAHRVDFAACEARVTGHLRGAFVRGRGDDPIIAGLVRVPAEAGELLED